MAKRVVKKVAKKKAAPKKRANAGGPSPEFMEMLTGALSQVSNAAGRAAALDKAREIHAYSGMPATVEQVIWNAETLRAYIEDGVVPGRAPEGECPVKSTDASGDEPYVLTPAGRTFGVPIGAGGIVRDTAEPIDTGGVRLGQ